MVNASYKKAPFYLPLILLVGSISVPVLAKENDQKIGLVWWWHERFISHRLDSFNDEHKRNHITFR